MIPGTNSKINHLFEKFVGPNDVFFPVEFRNDGCFSFRRHLYKPLSEELWNDLVHKLQPRNLVISYSYPFNVYVPHRPCECAICLDDYGLIQDILFVTWYR